MPFAVKLFKINFQNTYYSNELGSDFSLIPDEKTKHFMNHHKMQIVSYEGAVEVIWLTANFEDPLQVFEQKLAEHQLIFYVNVKNPYVFNFSSLKLDQAHIYYFINSTTSTTLHKNTYVGEEDKIPLKTITNLLDMPAPNTFAVINIQLDKLWKKKININQLPIVYTIQIKARETIWRYHIVDSYNHIKGATKVVIDKDDSYFIYKGTPENKHIHLYESKEPLMLRDTINQTFSLKMYPEKSTNRKSNTHKEEEILIEKLPLPDVTLMENNVVQGGVFYSNIIVYV